MSVVYKLRVLKQFASWNIETCISSNVYRFSTINYFKYFDQNQKAHCLKCFNTSGQNTASGQNVSIPPVCILLNITYRITRKAINVQQKIIRTKNIALRNPTIKYKFLWRLPILNYLKLSITPKRWNLTKYLTWNSIRLEFVKKTSMSNPVENLGYIKCCSLSSPRTIQSSSNSIRFKCQKIRSVSTRPKTILEIRKKSYFSMWPTSLLTICFLKTLLTTER